MTLDGLNGGHRVGATTVLFGLTVVLVGVLLTLQTNHLLPPDFLRKFWPLGIVAAGVIYMLRGVLGGPEMPSASCHGGCSSLC